MDFVLVVERNPGSHTSEGFVKQTVIVYGPGGYDPARPDNNVIESYEVDVPTPEPTVEDALRIAARLSADARIKAADLPDKDVATLSLLYDPWRVGEAVEVGMLKAWDGTIVECIQAHTTQSDWTPDAVPALWRVHRAATTGTPDPWVQPESTNPYQIGDRVLWTDGKVYESVIKDNVWSVSAYPQGWKLIP